MFEEWLSFISDLQSDPVTHKECSLAVVFGDLELSCGTARRLTWVCDQASPAVGFCSVWPHLTLTGSCSSMDNGEQHRKQAATNLHLLTDGCNLSASRQEGRGEIFNEKSVHSGNDLYTKRGRMGMEMRHLLSIWSSGELDASTLTSVIFVGSLSSSQSRNKGKKYIPLMLSFYKARLYKRSHSVISS